MKIATLRHVLLLIMAMIILAWLPAGPVAAGQKSEGAQERGADEAPFCSVHKERMALGRVPGRHGLVPPYVAGDTLLEEYFDSKHKHFPNTTRWFNEGCVGSTKEADLFYCGTCRRLEEEWLEKHPDFPKQYQLP